MLLSLICFGFACSQEEPNNDQGGIDESSVPVDDCKNSSMVRENMAAFPYLLDMVCHNL